MVASIAQQLKQIRESQGISLEAVAHRTHIPLTYLKAIEEGDEESLPSKVQLRGFLRLYANELGVELDDLRVGSYHLSKAKPPRIATEPSEEKVDTQPPSFESPDPAPDIGVEPEPETQPEPELEIDADKSSFPPDEFESELTSDAVESKASALIFTAIGAKLKQRRELLSLSIKDIQDNTHIREQYLVSLEAGAFDQLPSPVQAKGMLDNYSEFLNLDTESILLDYSEALQLQLKEKQKQLTKRDSRAARELSPTALRLKNFFTLDLLVVGTLFIAFAIFVIWGVNRILENDAPTILETDIPGVSDVLLAADTPTPVIPDDTEIIEIDQDQDQQIAMAEGEVGEAGEDVPLFESEVSTEPINIILLSRQRLWVQVTADGEIVFQGRLLPGNAYDFSAQDQIDILTGNIGSLQIIFNNEDIGSQGLVGQVADLSFTQTGLVLPPATPTPTITETPEASPTPTPTPEELDDETG
jgi:cytoskeleton protein RodZ